MSVSTTSGTRIFIGPITDVEPINDFERADDLTSALAIFTAIVEGDWEEIEEVESLGDFGDTSEAATFASLLDRRVRKMKTVYDAGTMAVVCGRDPLDAGQLALDAAVVTDYDYAFKLIYKDARDESHTDSVEYFGGMVMGKQTNAGGVSDVTKKTYNIGINTAVYAVPSEAGS